MRKAREDEAIYNAIIISLAIGIVIVIITLVVARPPREYFTELYFKNHTNLPKYINPQQYYNYTFVVHNVEKSTFTYQMRLSTELTLANKSTITSDEYFTNLTVAQGAIVEQPVSFVIKNPFHKAKVTSQVLNKNQEVHFWVYNKEMVMEYPDLVAMVQCLKNLVNITEANYFIVYAKGSFNPNMKIRLNGEEVYSAAITSGNFTNYTVSHSIGPGTMDIIFDNDFSNQTAKIDRNIFIDYIKIGDQIIRPEQGVVDKGQGGKAFDCEDTVKGTGNIYWNAALRFRIE
jgi:hypothetical protein